MAMSLQQILFSLQSKKTANLNFSSLTNWNPILNLAFFQALVFSSFANFYESLIWKLGFFLKRLWMTRKISFDVHFFAKKMQKLQNCFAFLPSFIEKFVNIILVLLVDSAKKTTCSFSWSLKQFNIAEHCGHSLSSFLYLYTPF